MKFEIGMKVIATKVITEGGGDTIPDPAATFESRSPGYVHSPKDGEGTVEYINDDGYPTVRFDFRGTATIVGNDEVEPNLKRR